jgi:hypothetical protein
MVSLLQSTAMGDKELSGSRVARIKVKRGWMFSAKPAEKLEIRTEMQVSNVDQL